jgi:hypothetical protein
VVQHQRTLAAMQDSQAALARVIESSRRQQQEALEEVLRSGSAAAQQAAQTMLENAAALKETHDEELALMKDVAKQMSELKASIRNIGMAVDGVAAGVTAVHLSVGSVGVDVKSLIEMMSAMKSKLDERVAPPDEQKRRLLASLSACSVQLAALDGSMQAVYLSAPSALQEALKSAQRQVVLIRDSAASLDGKVQRLSASSFPVVAIEDLLSAVRHCCGDLSARTPAAEVLAMQPRLRFALQTLCRSNREAELLLEGQGSVASAHAPPGWPRALWEHAVGAHTYSAPLSALSSLPGGGYVGPAADVTRLSAFLAQKEQDAALGAADRVDVFEWAAMAAAPAECIAPAAQQPSGLEAQRWLDRMLALAKANKADDDFRIAVELEGQRPPSAAEAELMRGFSITATRRVANKIGQPVTLLVRATKNCYFYMLEQDSSGKLCPLVPVAYDDDSGASIATDNRLSANAARRFPASDGSDGMEITFSEPPGLERVVVFASQTPLENWDLSDARARNVNLTRGLSVKASGGIASYELTFDLSR